MPKIIYQEEKNFFFYLFQGLSISSIRISIFDRQLLLNNNEKKNALGTSGELKSIQKIIVLFIFYSKQMIVGY